MFCVEFRVFVITRPSRGGGGAVGWRGRGAVWRKAPGVRVGPEAQEKELGLCRDTVFNLAEGTIEGKVQSMYSWVPSAPPARRRTVWGSSSLPPSVGREGAGKRRASVVQECGAPGNVVQKRRTVVSASDAEGQPAQARDCKT